MTQRRTLLMTGLATAFAGTGLSGCANPTVQDYANEKPELHLPSYFNGTIDAWGMFTDRNAKIVKRFTVVMRCAWQDNQGTFDEDFVYSDGKTEKRIWKLTDKGNGFYTGTAGDVVGVAEGQTKGNAFNWSYTLALPVEGTTLHVHMDDWMFLMNDRVMLNKARMTKLWVHLGDVTLSFMRRA